MPADATRRATIGRLAVAVTALAAGLWPATPAVHAAPGDLDVAFAGFGAGGVAAIAQPAEWRVRALALQPDGKVVVAGATVHSVLVRRLLPNGAPEASFGTDGLATFRDPEIDLKGAAVAIQADGRIVVAGDVTNAARTESDAALARFLPDGAPVAELRR